MDQGNSRGTATNASASGGGATNNANTNTSVSRGGTASNANEQWLYSFDLTGTSPDDSIVH